MIKTLKDLLLGRKRVSISVEKICLAVGKNSAGTKKVAEMGVKVQQTELCVGVYGCTCFALTYITYYEVPSQYLAAINAAPSWRTSIGRWDRDAVCSHRDT